MKWKIAALTLITWPVAFCISARSSDTSNPKFLIYFASLPLLVAVGIELKDKWKLAKEHPELYEVGSPIGNKIAAFLGFIVLILLLWLVLHAATFNT